MNEHEFTKGNNYLCPDDHLWHSRDDQSSEDEVNEFLGALIRLIKPEFVVETGCYLGDGTLAIARALKWNGRGTLISCDIDPTMVTSVIQRIKDESLEAIAQVVLCEGKELIKDCGARIDFAFIDSSPEGKIRGEEIKELLKHLRPGKLFALHDTAPQHPQIRAVANSIDLPKIYFNTPRGFNLFQNK